MNIFNMLLQVRFSNRGIRAVKALMFYDVTFGVLVIHMSFMTIRAGEFYTTDFTYTFMAGHLECFGRGDTFRLCGQSTYDEYVFL